MGVESSHRAGKKRISLCDTNIIIYSLIQILLFIYYLLYIQRFVFVFHFLHDLHTCMLLNACGFGISNYIITDTENIKLVFCAVKDTIMQTALKEFNLA